MTTKRPGTPARQDKKLDDGALTDAIRRYVRTYALWHGRAKAAETFGVSHPLAVPGTRPPGATLPRAVTKAVGNSPDAIEAATWAMNASRAIARRGAASRYLPETLEDTLLLLCAASLATAKELAGIGRVPATTLRDRLAKLGQRGLVDSVSHHLGALGPPPRRRYFPTERGIDAGAKAEHGRERFLSEYPVSREWLRLLAERLDAVALLYHVAGLVADADPEEQPVRVDHYRPGALRRPDHLVRGPLRGPAAPRTNPALGQPALPPANPGKPALLPEANGYPDSNPLRPSDPPGLPYPGQPDGAPHHLRRHRGRIAGGRR